MATAVRWLVVGVLAVHGSIHLLGVVKGLGWAEVGALRHPVTPAAALLWLAAAVLVLTTAVMIAVGAPAWWWACALAAAVVSQGAVLTSWSDARAGTAANLVLLLVAAYGFASLGPGSFAAAWQRQARAALDGTPPSSRIIRATDLRDLPEPVARYVRRSGAVGRPAVTSFYAELHGRIRSGPDAPWMPFTGRQVNTFGPDPRRLFYLDATMHGLPVSVLHAYSGGTATMQGKLFSLVPVMDGHGPVMDRGETVTVLNDLAVFAPAALVDAPIAWTPLGPRRARAAYTVAGRTVTADLVFDDAGDLVDFRSEDRARASSDGSTFTRTPWSTPLTRYRDLGGRRVAVQGAGRWDAPAPEGPFTYVELHVDRLAYNVSGTRWSALRVVRDPVDHR